MRPEFGCAVHDLVFDTIDAAMIGKLETAIRGALDRWEPRIEVEDLTFDLSAVERRPAADHHQLPDPHHEQPAQPRLPLLRDPGGGERVRLPAIDLDDRRFQDLVSEARLRINRACPEWTEHNVSDPGITLIELFAWMTEMTIYRLNRVPDKLHVALMELLGIRLDGPTGAHTELRFRLSAPADRSIDIPGGETEIGTRRTATEESIVFQVDEDFTIPPARPAAYVVQRGNKFSEIGVVDGTAKPQGADQVPFSAPPLVGDALYLGFEEDIGRLILQVSMEASTARGAGVDPEDPPLRWEVSGGDGQWEDAEVLEDLTGGFNYGSGTVELQCPPRSAIEPLAGKRLRWLRCRIDDKTRTGASTTYTHPPEIYSITAAPVGALLESSHSARAESEILGVSDGTPGQVFQLRNAPVLKPRTERAPGGAGPRVGRLGALGAARELRRLDPVRAPLHARRRLRRGRAGPGDPRDRRRLVAVRRGAGQGRRRAHEPLPLRRRPGRQRLGRDAQRAAQPDPRHRHGHEPASAAGGVDAEPIEHARARASMEIRTRYRAVTAEDFEFLAGEASPRVARAVCLVPPEDGGPVPLQILPARLPRRPPAELRGARARTRRSCARSASTSTPGA